MRLKDRENLDPRAADSIHDSVIAVDQFPQLRHGEFRHSAPAFRKRRKTLPLSNELFDKSFGSINGITRHVITDCGKTRVRLIRPDNLHALWTARG